VQGPRAPPGLLRAWPHRRGDCSARGRGWLREELPATALNVHQAETAEKRLPLQETIASFAAITPTPLLSDFFKAVLRKLLEATTASDGTQGALETQCSLLELLIALSPSLDSAQTALLWRAVRPHLRHTEVVMQKKAYKTLAAIADHQQGFVREKLVELREAIGEALPDCHSACKRKRLVCLQALLLQVSAAQLQQMLPAVLGEVVLATREENAKTRGSAFDSLLTLAEQVERTAPSSAQGKVQALQSVLVMVTAGLAGKTPHMMAAALSSLARLLFEYRERPELVPFSVQLFQTVITLLEHKAQEVVRAVVVFIKVILSTVPVDAVKPLLPQLVPPMLGWCSNKHAHLKYQIRYLMERLVKRFGFDTMLEATPEAHHRLLTHMRKRKERERRHVEARLAAAGRPVDDKAEGAARGSAQRGRHSDYEALLGEGDGDELTEEAELEFGERGRATQDVNLRETWRDQSEHAADLDLLSAPLAQPGARRSSSAKRRRDGGSGSEGGRPDDAGLGDDAGVSVNEEGKLVIAEEGAPAAAATAAAGGGNGGMEVDTLDEVVRVGQNDRLNKKRRHLEQQVVEASAAEKAEERKQPPKRGSRYTLSKKRRSGPDHFGASFGDQYVSKKGAKGDVLRPGAPQPFAYLPLNPRMMGKKQKRKADETTGKILGRGKNKGGNKGAKAGGARR